MADDEIQQTKQQHHAQLAAEHTRLAQFHETHSGGESASAPGGSPSAGSQMGDFMSAIMSHKWIIIGGIAVVIILFVVVLPQFKSSSSGTTSSNTSPNYLDSSGYVPANITEQLANINAQISQLEQQQQKTDNNGNTLPTIIQWQRYPGEGPLTPWALSPTSPSIQRLNSSTNTNYLTSYRQTLSSVGQLNSINLRRIENLNPGVNKVVI